MSQALTLEEFKSWEGRELPPTEWFVVGQDRINQFAECTNDHQYIHVDPERMKDSSFGSTIAHGFLSLSLLAGYGPSDGPQLQDVVMSINYGLDRVRFINPVRVNSKVRFLTKIISITEKSPGRVIVKTEKTLEIDGEEKPALVAECLGMLVTSDEAI